MPANDALLVNVPHDKSKLVGRPTEFRDERKAPDYLDAVSDGNQAQRMVELIDTMLEERSPKVETTDGSIDKTPRAITCQVVVRNMGAVNGVLSETTIPGIYRIMTNGQDENKVPTMMEVFVDSGDITAIVMPRPDITEMIRQAQRNGAGNGEKSKIWTP